MVYADFCHKQKLTGYKKANGIFCWLPGYTLTAPSPVRVTGEFSSYSGIVFPRRKPEPPVNWGEVERAWDPRAGHLSFVFRSYGIIGQRDSLSRASRMSFWNVLLKGEEAKSYLHLPEVFSGSWPLGGVFCSVPDYFAVAFWRTQIPLWSGRSPLRLSREWLRPYLRCLLLALPACQGTTQSLGEVIRPWKPRREISSEV